MKPTTCLAALTVSALAAVLLSSPAGALDREDRKLCSEATEDPKTLLACVKSLNLRLAEIEDEPDDIEAPDDTDEKIAKLEAELQAAKAEIDALKDGPTKIKAPFTVVDETDKVLFTVDTDGGDPIVLVGNRAGSHIVLEAESDRAVIAAGNGDHIIKMEAGGNMTAVTAGDDKGEVGMGHISTGFSGFLFRKDGHDVANLGIMPGKLAAVRVYNESGQGIAAIGSNPQYGGAGAVYIGNGQSNGVEMEAYNGGDGEVRVTGGGPYATVALRGKEKQVAVFGDSGTPLAVLSESQNSKGGNVTLSSPGGDGVFSAGAATDGGGEACVNRQNGVTTCLGIGLPLR